MIKDLHEKDITDLKQKELIHVFLSKQTQPFQLKHHILRTTFSIATEGIKETLTNANTKDILPIMGIFSVFDILGSAFHIIGNKSTENVPLKKCLKLFSDNKKITGNDIDALYALRNALIHNSSLVSTPIKNSQSHYYFRYDNNLNKIVSHAEQEWNGNFEILDNGSHKFTTYINTKKLFQLMESCINNIKSLSDKDLINLNYKKGKREFFYRYFRLVKNKFTESEQLSIKKMALSTKVKGKIDKILESNDYKNFMLVHLGEHDKYNDSSDKVYNIFEHQDSLVVDEIKRNLVQEYMSKTSYKRELALFYSRDIYVSSKYRIELQLK